MNSADELIGLAHPSLNRKSHVEIWSHLKNDQMWSGLLTEELVNSERHREDLIMQTLIFPVVSTEREQEYLGLQVDVTELKKAKSMMQDISNAQNYFLTNVGHQLRSPLSAIIGGLKMLTPASVDSRDAKVVELVLQNAKELMHNVNELIHYADLETGKVQVNFAPVLIHKEFDEFLETFFVAAEEKSVNFSFLIDEKIPGCLSLDAQNIFKVLDNLLNNAFKFTPADGEIRVEISMVSRLDNRLTLEFAVVDTGIGIEDKQLARIFSSFQQLEAIGARQYGGTGIGLTIAQKLVRLMGGNEIEVDSHPQHGSRFRFQLPTKVC